MESKDVSVVSLCSDVFRHTFPHFSFSISHSGKISTLLRFYGKNPENDSRVVLPRPLKKPCRGTAIESRVWDDHRMTTIDPGADPPFNGHPETGPGLSVKESVPQNDLGTTRYPGNEPTHTCNGHRRPQSEVGMRPPIRLDVPPPGVESAYRVCTQPDFGATRPVTEKHSQQRY